MLNHKIKTMVDSGKYHRNKKKSVRENYFFMFDSTVKYKQNLKIKNKFKETYKNNYKV